MILRKIPLSILGSAICFLEATVARWLLRRRAVVPLRDKLSGSRKQHSTKTVAAKAASFGPQYRLACTGSQKRTSTLNPFRSYFHVDSILAAGIERLTAELISTFRFATKIHRASNRVLALELREQLTDCQRETQDCWDKYHCNEPVSNRPPSIAFANAVVSAGVSFKLPRPGRAGPSTTAVKASDDPVIVHSSNITADKESVEPAATPVVSPAASAMPEAPLEAEAQHGPGISSVFCSSLSQLATMLLPARGRPLPTPTVTEPQSQQADPVLLAPVPIPKPHPLSIPSLGISPISSGDKASNISIRSAPAKLATSTTTSVGKPNALH